MKLSLTFGDSTIDGDRVIEQLNRFGLMPQLLQEIATDDLVEEMAIDWSDGLISATAVNLESTSTEFEQKYAEIERLPLCQGMNESQLSAICDRSLRLQKFKVGKWGAEVESHFQAYGTGLDRVLISILQVKDATLARELFFRIESGEKSFAETAIDYSQGIHAQNGGVMGPLLLGDLTPGIRKIVEGLATGELSQLFQVDRYYTFIRLDKREMAVLDDLRYQFLLDRLFENWLKSQL